jgi:uncharacterized coiled-coil DUF342 family protein
MSISQKESSAIHSLSTDVPTLHAQLRATIKEREELRMEAKQLQGKYKEHKKKNEGLTTINNISTQLVTEQSARQAAEKRVQQLLEQHATFQQQLGSRTTPVTGGDVSAASASTRPPSPPDATGPTGYYQRAINDPRIRAAVSKSADNSILELQTELTRAVQLAQQLIEERNQMAQQRDAMGAQLEERRANLEQIRIHDANLASRCAQLEHRLHLTNAELKTQNDFALKYFRQCAELPRERDALEHEVDILQVQIDPVAALKQDFSIPPHMKPEAAAFLASRPQMSPPPGLMLNSSTQPIQPPIGINMRQSSIESTSVSVSSPPPSPGKENPVVVNVDSRAENKRSAESITSTNQQSSSAILDTDSVSHKRQKLLSPTQMNADRSSAQTQSMRPALSNWMNTNVSMHTSQPPNPMGPIPTHTNVLQSPSGNTSGIHSSNVSSSTFG